MLVLVATLLWSATALAQGLPPPSRTAYRCELDGKIVYSDSPCLGAEKLELQPTRGLNKSSGRVQVGADVQREHSREAFAEAVRPLTGLDARQLDQAGRRTRLSPELQQRCQRLDRELPLAERQERQATTSLARQEAQRQLWRQRKAYRDGGCE
ncbi:MAG: DUF4124 domain-containing protein [Inhella sp.]